MKIEELDNLDLPAGADFHVHLRDGPMMDTVVGVKGAGITKGGVDTVYVMPNLIPPITTVDHALDYHARLKKLAPDVQFLMTLYLHETITADTIMEAATKGKGIIYGVKYYPKGVTTNSSSGIIDLKSFYPVFSAMQEHNIVLNLHGEVPNTPPSSYSSSARSKPTTILNAEPHFLPTLLELHQSFPSLRIVLEHCTTAEALNFVLTRCGPTVAATVTAHHLWITTDDVCGNAWNFCKPVAKSLVDRVELVKAVVEGSGRVFFGSDSAPHPISAKTPQPGIGSSPAAGCFTQPWVTQLVVGALKEGVKNGWIEETQITREVLEGFLGGYGRRFYGLDANSTQSGQRKSRIRLSAKGEKIDTRIYGATGSGVEIVPFMCGQEIYSLEWR